MTSTIGTQRAAALLTAKNKANTAFYANTPSGPETEPRQSKRRRELLAAKHEDRPGPRKPLLIPKPGKPDRTNAHHVWTVMRGIKEVYLHATKGIRTRTREG